MENKNLIFVSIAFLSLLFVSCGSDASLQKYYVESQESSNFIALDIPASIITLKEDVPAETKETLNSLKKLNVLAFKLDADNVDEFKSENKRVKSILKNKKYNELMRGKHKNINFQIKYLGDDDNIDEVVLYASETSQGFVIARVLGDNMKPEKIMKLINNLDNIDKDNPAISQLEGFIGGFN